MSINTDNLELFYKDFLSGKNRYSFFLGGTDVLSDLNTAKGDRNVWEDISVVSNVRGNDAKPVVRRINYVNKKSYDPWRASGNNISDNYYVFNEADNTVYLCISSNSLNRSDLFKTSNSTYTPSFSENEKTYPDGYKWKKLYKIDNKSRKFLTDNLMPVEDVASDYVPYPTGIGLNALSSVICSGNPGACGACGLYPKKQEYDPPTSSVTRAGYLWQSFEGIRCWDCFDLAQRLDMEYSFISGASASDLESYITIESNIDKIKNSDFSPFTNENIQSNLMYSSSAKDGEILSVFLDLSDVSYDDRKVDVENPRVVITSATGVNAVAYLITYKDSSGNNIVDGIRLENGGYGYYDYTLSIPTISNASTFTNRIEVNIEPPDGYATSIRKLLNCTQIAFRLEFDSKEILNANINQKTFTSYGMMKNIETTTSKIYGSDLNLNQRTINSNLVTLTLDGS